ncbi:MAG TPA: sugar ABC transporter permease, partial [Candidatus Gallimonas intestinigallinarum]|nr:sugar ABC transporter permease [Candidatus Gallimonas intestinigallinarum]
DIVPPRLVDWVGFENFGKLVAVGEYATTFFKIFGWNILWAVLSTGINYFGGLALALLLNKSCVKGRVFWRFFPILAYAIPGFITMLGFKFMFANGGPINYYITQGGGDAIFFFGANSTWPARFIGLMVNAWISIPSSMLLATGILSNANKDQYEAAKIDGANAFQQFWYLTLPFVVFATTPVILSQFIGNFNNFGVFYFLRSDVDKSAGYVLANDTDLLINWLYKMSIDNNYYSIGAAISLIIFIITSVISLVVYIFSPSYRQEETYR